MNKMLSAVSIPGLIIGLSLQNGYGVDVGGRGTSKEQEMGLSQNLEILPREIQHQIISNCHGADQISGASQEESRYNCNNYV